MKWTKIALKEKLIAMTNVYKAGHQIDRQVKTLF